MRRREMPDHIKNWICRHRPDLAPRFGIRCNAPAPPPPPPPPEENLPPTANAGPDQQGIVGTPVFLDATRSTDPSGRTLSFAWTLEVPSGSRSLLQNSTTQIATFVPDVDGSYVARLTVSAGGQSDTDDVAIRVRAADVVPPPPDPPVQKGFGFLNQADMNRMSRNRPDWDRVSRAASSRSPRVSRGQWFVPWYYGSSQSQHLSQKNLILDDAETALANAIVAKVQNSSTNAGQAIRIMDAWAANVTSISNREDSSLVFAYSFPTMIVAADVIRRAVSWSGEGAFSNWLGRVAITAAENILHRENNWGSWGLCLKTFIAAHIGDDRLLRESWTRFQHYVGDQIKQTSGRWEMQYEVRRSGSGQGDGSKGLTYSCFGLGPLCYAAMALDNNGYAALNYTAASGANLEKAWKQLSAWMRNPSSFPYNNNPQMNWPRYSFTWMMLWNFNDANAASIANRASNSYEAINFNRYTHS